MLDMVRNKVSVVYFCSMVSVLKHTHALTWMPTCPQRSAEGMCPLELELQVVVSHPAWALAAEFGSFERAASILSH